MKYYAMIDGESRGPYDIDQLADAGVRPSTYIWCKGMDDWEKAEDVAEVCRMFRNRLYDLMHPAPIGPIIDESFKEIPSDKNNGSQGYTRFDRHLDQSGAELPSIEEIEERENKIPPSPLLLPVAILTTIFCFLPTGIIAILFAIKAKKVWAQNPGSKEAGQYCRAAKMWTGITFFLGFIFTAFLSRLL